jgi:tripartite-type tricarboxylate transporter receptor subunit TctC
MNSVNRTIACWLTSAVLGYCGVAIAQDKPPDYPTRPIRLVVAASPGAGGDMMARAVAQMLTEAWGQNAIVDNRSGASGSIGVELVARSAPDGYTLLSLGDTLMILGATKRVPFDVLKAFDPVVPTSTQPYILLAHSSLTVKSIKELVAYSATRTVTYSGSTGVGAPVHLGMERLAQLSGAKLQFIPYKGTAPAIIAAMGGEIQMAVASTLSATGAMRTGKLRGLAALSLTRVPSMPDLPTVAEQGFPDFKIINRYGVQAPAGTPRRILNALNRVVSDGMYSPQMVQRLQADGSQPAERMTPEQFKAALAREYAEVEQQVKRLNIKIE